MRGGGEDEEGWPVTMVTIWPLFDHGHPREEELRGTLATQRGGQACNIFQVCPLKKLGLDQTGYFQDMAGPSPWREAKSCPPSVWAGFGRTPGGHSRPGAKGCHPLLCSRRGERHRGGNLPSCRHYLKCSGTAALFAFSHDLSFERLCGGLSMMQDSPTFCPASWS